MFVPSGWYHYVCNNSDAISINTNFVNASNICHVWAFVSGEHRRALQQALGDSCVGSSVDGAVLQRQGGMGYSGFYELIRTVAERELAVLSGAAAAPAPAAATGASITAGSAAAGGGRTSVAVPPPAPGAALTPGIADLTALCSIHAVLQAMVSELPEVERCAVDILEQHKIVSGATKAAAAAADGPQFQQSDLSAALEARNGCSHNSTGPPPLAVANATPSPSLDTGGDSKRHAADDSACKCGRLAVAAADTKMASSSAECAVLEPVVTAARAVAEGILADARGLLERADCSGGLQGLLNRVAAAAVQHSFL